MQWLLVIVILAGSTIEQGGMKVYQSQKDCETDRADIHGQLKGVTLWSKCIPLEKSSVPYKKERDS